MFEKQLKSLAKRLGYQLIPIDAGRSPWVAKQKLLKDIKAPVIFDVGASVGDTIKRYQKMFQASKIFAFEPFDESFRLAEIRGIKGDSTKLRPACAGHTRVFRMALGATTGKQAFHVNMFSPTNSLLPSDERVADIWGAGHYETEKTIEVDVMRLDDFVSREGIDGIDLLKMDVQGAEYQVLEGARDTLARGKIGIIYTEVIVAPAYQGQKSLKETLEIFEEIDFQLYNIYDIYSIDGQISHFDAIFVRN